MQIHKYLTNKPGKSICSTLCTHDIKWRVNHNYPCKNIIFSSSINLEMKSKAINSFVFHIWKILSLKFSLVISFMKIGNRFIKMLNIEESCRIFNIGFVLSFYFWILINFCGTMFQINRICVISYWNWYCIFYVNESYANVLCFCTLKYAPLINMKLHYRLKRLSVNASTQLQAQN